MIVKEDVTIDQSLTNYAIDYMRGGNFAADILAPVVEVIKEEASYHVFNEKGVNMEYDTKRADGTKATEIRYSKTTDTYKAEEEALRILITDRALRNADSVVKVEQKATRHVTGKIRLGIEAAVKTLLTNTSTFNNDTPTIKWDGTDPIIFADIADAKSDFRKQCGVDPNLIVFPSDVASVVANDSAFLDRIKYTHGDLIANGSLPPIIQGMRTLIPGAVRNTAEPGLTETVDYVWNDDTVGLYFVDPNPGIDTMTVANQFRVKQLGTIDIAIAKYVEPGIKGYYIEGSVITVPKVVASIAGYLIHTTLTP